MIDVHQGPRMEENADLAEVVPSGTEDSATEHRHSEVHEDRGGILGNDSGMSTIEYALGCVAAAALGALLYLVVTSDSVEAALTGIFERALETK